MKKTNRYRIVAEMISAALILGLAVCVISWRVGRPNTTVPGFAAAMLSASLFAVFGVRWVRSWLREWQDARPSRDTRPCEEESVPPADMPDDLCCDSAPDGSADLPGECAVTGAGNASAPDDILPCAEEPVDAMICADLPEDAAAPVEEPDDAASVCDGSVTPADMPADALPCPEQPVAASLPTMFKIFLLGVAACVAGLLLVYLFQLISGRHLHFWDAAQIWGRLDSQHYFDIAREWYLSEGEYGRIVQLVFLPGFPVVLRAVTALTGNMFLSGILISIFSFSLGCVVLYRLVLLDADHATALRAVRFAMLMPGAFFMAAPMSDALFFLLSVSCVYFIRRDNWLAAGLVGAAATFTRTLGLVLLAPAVYTMVTRLYAEAGSGRRADWRRRARYLAILLIPVGFAGYCFICWQVSGNPFQFLIYQREHWGQTAGYFFNTAAYQTERAISVAEGTNWNNLFGLWLPNIFCSFFSLAVMALSVRRMRPAQSLYFMGYFVIAIGVTWLLSAPRYLAACFPICIGLARLTEKQKWNTAITIAMTVVYVLYAMMMANRWQVW